MAIDDAFAPDKADGGFRAAPPPVQELTATGAITIAEGKVFLNSGSVIAATIDAPPTNMNGAALDIIAVGAAAHTVTFATTGFNGAGASGDVATFGGAKGDSMRIVAHDGVWYTESLRNVTLG